MIQVLRLCVWKEWREQRATAGMLGSLIALFVAGAGVLLPRDPYRDPLVLSSVALACAAFALVAIGGELLAGEERRGTLRFLERTPAGLRAAFLGKLALFALVVPATAVWGLGVALVVTRARSGAWPETLLETRGPEELALFAALALWTFAASTWVSRGALALPLAAMLLALLGWPLWLAVGGDPWFQPVGSQLRIFLALCCASALAAAWHSFTRGLALGRGSLGAAWRGLAIGALLLSPSWGWVASRWQTARTIDPAGSDFAILGCTLVADGQRALVSVARRLPGTRRALGPIRTRAWMVELDSGAWSEVDGRELPWPSHASHDAGWKLQLPAEHVLELPADVRVVHPCGQGLRLRRLGSGGSSGQLFYDFTRKRIFEAAELFPEDEHAAIQTVFVRAGRWIVREGSRARGRWVALDPESAERAPIDALSAGDVVEPMLADGRFIVLRDGALACFDLEAGSLAPVRFAGGEERRIEHAHDARGGAGALLGVLDPIVLSLWIDGRREYARLDPERLELSLASPLAARSNIAHFVATPERDSLIAIEDERRIVRLHFDGREREILFPREP